MNRQRPLFSFALGLEAIGLSVLALASKMYWLLPWVGCAALLAGLAGRWLGVGIVVCIVATGGWVWTLGQNMPDGAILTAHPIGALLIGAALAFLNIHTALKKRDVSPVQLCLGRLAVLLHFITAGVLLGALYLGGSWQRWIALAYAVLNALLVLDCLLRLVGRLYTPKRHWQTLPEPGALFFYRLLGDEWRACLPETTARDESFDLKLAEMWMWPTLRAALPSLLSTIVLLVWLLSTVHELPAGHAGVRHHLGTWESRPLAPGLHFSLPWPMGSIQAVDTTRLREIVLGFRTDPGQPILWEKAHYEGEQHSLVGGGDDFLSISVPVFYRVGDAALHLRSSSDAEALLRSLAQRVLLNLTLRLPARDIMTTSREALRQQLHRDLQAALDERQSGLVLAEVYLRDIHPPVSVAPNFQEVVSALEEKEALLHEGEAYRRDILTRTEGDAKAILITAGSSASNRLMQTEGQAHRFTAMQKSWALGKDLYQWREGYRALDETLSGAKKAIFDESMRGDMPTHVDLRKVLNPDFVDTAPVRPQTLVPRPAKSTDAFDLDIEGYLRADQGEVPAPDFSPPDADNVLKASSSTPTQPPAQTQP
ncbi:protease modulator HflK [Prosthecobacter dejongeii]|uniref:Regulator of protease activity HflC (Stomatin/prohibitin superfamily) n=1 Tax=Prosthecobacter dejongeii TaxID=48465 RepID=A0A7W7YMK6_9BACT|nr:protease modulator HflK [Prosthecobacter dejongeii]MBB5038849.1 regulator of protease activity HflC (stomatin/prohibitin superfamily) [Prosthecobacter dejongeii]